MKIAFVFNGQGSQTVKMGKDLYEAYDAVKEVFDQTDIKDLCFYGPSEELNNTANTQICVFTVSLAIANLLKQNGLKPEYVAGLSLGEYSALCFSEALSLKDGLKIVKARGLLMADELADSDSGMVAVMNLSADKIEEIVEEVNQGGLCQIANYNSNSQIVITGINRALSKAAVLIKENGGRAVPLKVSGAFHSSLLDRASAKLYQILKDYEFKKPKFKVVYNISGKESDENIIDILSKQINHSVYFKQSIEYMIDQGVDTFVEIGPGKALSAFIRNINPEVKVYSVNDLSSYESLKRELIDE